MLEIFNSSVSCLELLLCWGLWLSSAGCYIWEVFAMGCGSGFVSGMWFFIGVGSVGLPTFLAVFLLVAFIFFYLSVWFVWGSLLPLVMVFGICYGCLVEVLFRFSVMWVLVDLLQIGRLVVLFGFSCGWSPAGSVVSLVFCGVWHLVSIVMDWLIFVGFYCVQPTWSYWFMLRLALWLSLVLINPALCDCCYSVQDVILSWHSSLCYLVYHYAGILGSVFGLVQVLNGSQVSHESVVYFKSKSTTYILLAFYFFGILLSNHAGFVDEYKLNLELLLVRDYNPFWFFGVLSLMHLSMLLGYFCTVFSKGPSTHSNFILTFLNVFLLLFSEIWAPSKDFVILHDINT